jgi:hypothetical protein
LNRAVATALTLLCASMTLQVGLMPEGLAQVKEEASDKQERIDKFQDRRLIFEPSPSPAGAQDYQLRQGPDTIYDADFVELMNDKSLTNFWLGERNRDWAYWIGSGAVAVPLGGMLFANNFRAQGPLAFFANGSQAQGVNASDWRTFGLSVVGVALAAYGAYNLTQWVAESLDLSHPNRLDADSIAPRVTEWNDQLRERLNLDPEDIPSPPPPRPSPSPVPSGSVPPDNTTSTGIDQSQLGLTPSPPVGGPDSWPQGAPPSNTSQIPLPVISPGRLPPSGAPSPTPKPRPSEFFFPEFASPSPKPTAAASPTRP